MGAYRKRPSGILVPDNSHDELIGKLDELIRAVRALNPRALRPTGGPPLSDLIRDGHAALMTNKGGSKVREGLN